LTHVTVWFYVDGFNREHSFLQPGSMLNFSFCLALSLGLAAVLYKGIEEPYRRVLRGYFGNRVAALSSSARRQAA
jgi:peptidoglycan/LPS O-acetylase OafA/YrhL